MIHSPVLGCVLRCDSSACCASVFIHFADVMVLKALVCFGASVKAIQVPPVMHREHASGYTESTVLCLRPLTEVTHNLGE